MNWVSDWRLGSGDDFEAVLGMAIGVTTVGSNFDVLGIGDDRRGS